MTEQLQAYYIFLTCSTVVGLSLYFELDNSIVKYVKVVFLAYRLSIITSLVCEQMCNAFSLSMDFMDTQKRGRMVSCPLEPPFDLSL